MIGDVLAVQWRRLQYRWTERRRRRRFLAHSPEVQATLLVDYIANNSRLRKQLRNALRMKDGA